MLQRSGGTPVTSCTAQTTESYLVVFYSDCHFCLNYRLFRTQEFSKSLPFMAGFLKFQTVFTFLQNYLQTNLIIHLR